MEHFFNFLWPSQNIWNLHSTTSWLIQLTLSSGNIQRATSFLPILLQCLQKDFFLKDKMAFSQKWCKISYLFLRNCLSASKFKYTVLNKTLALFLALIILDAKQEKIIGSNQHFFSVYMPFFLFTCESFCLLKLLIIR